MYQLGKHYRFSIEPLDEVVMSLLPKLINHQKVRLRKSFLNLSIRYYPDLGNDWFKLKLYKFHSKAPWMTLKGEESDGWCSTPRLALSWVQNRVAEWRKSGRLKHISSEFAGIAMTTRFEHFWYALPVTSLYFKLCLNVTYFSDSFSPVNHVKQLTGQRDKRSRDRSPSHLHSKILSAE